MGLGVDMGTVGFDSRTTRSEPPTSAAPILPGAFGTLDVGSPVARVLFELWSGREITVVSSPPGAGKSTVIVQTIEQLLARDFGRIRVITPTRRAALDLAERVGAALGLDERGRPRVLVAMNLKGGERLTRNVQQRSGTVDQDSFKVWVGTCAGALATRLQNGIVELMIVDEAYQLTFNDVARAAENARQVLLVGDPGQIPPIVTANVDAWSDRKAAPYMKAPEVFLQDDSALEVRLPSTYRFGADTVRAIAPLYDFRFGSARPDRFVRNATGSRLPEINVQHTTFEGEADVEAMRVVADCAASFLGSDFVELDEDMQPVVRRLDGSDIAVVVARRSQTAVVAAMLAARGGEAAAITVGTADKLQGGQWPAVVAVDPLSGSADADSFRTHTGRLSVMISRHMAHLTWVHDGSWAEKLEGLTTADAKRGFAVRQALTGPQR